MKEEAEKMMSSAGLCFAALLHMQGNQLILNLVESLFLINLELEGLYNTYLKPNHSNE